MSTDNRIEINDCEDDTVTFTTGGGALGTNTLTGNLYEGAASVQARHTNAYEETYTTTDSGGTTLNLDLTDSTVYILVKDNGLDLASNAGAMVYLGDGTNNIGYTAGGSDALGILLRRQFYSFKVDGNQANANPGTADQDHHVFGGTEANLTFAAVSEVGYASLHNAKAQGNVANVFIDRMTYIANGEYALTISGGAGSPAGYISTADVVLEDETNGWGMVSNPIGTAYYFFAPTEWGTTAGSPTGDCYFEISDEQWFWLGDNGGGRPLGETHFPMRIVGAANDVTDVRWTNLSIVNVGTRAQLLAGDANVDIMFLENVAFTDVGTITFPAQDAGNKYANNNTFNNCDIVDPSTLDMASPTFNGGNDPNGALWIKASVDNITEASFSSDGTGHGVYITVAGTYDFDNWSFTGYGPGGSPDTDAAIFNNSGGLVTINILNGGDTPSVRNGLGSTTVINNSVTLLVQGVTEGAACKIVANETVGTITTGDILLEELAGPLGTASASLNYEGAFDPSGLDVITRVRASGLPTAAIQDDNGVFTDETTAANSAVAADMNLLPTTPVVNQDRYLFGHAEMFDKLKIEINTVGLGGFTITWQYWNGAWTNLSNVIDGTNSFANAGVNYVEFDLPTDWVTTTINSQGPYYYIRAAFTAGTVTQSPKGTRCSLDVTKYLPFDQNGVVTSDGLTVTASWVVDTIARFKP